MHLKKQKKKCRNNYMVYIRHTSTLKTVKCKSIPKANLLIHKTKKLLIIISFLINYFYAVLILREVTQQESIRDESIQRKLERGCSQTPSNKKNSD